MSDHVSRESYMESEFKKWQEKFEIPFEKEFDVKALLSLQYQFMVTPDEHIKSKKDLIDAIHRLQYNLKLEPVTNPDEFKILAIVNNQSQKGSLFEMFKKLLGDKIIESSIKTNSPGELRTKLRTKDCEISILTCSHNNIDHLRGRKADYILNMTGSRDVDEYFRDQNKL